MRILKYLSFLFPKTIANKALKLFLTPEKIDRPESELPWYNSSKKSMVAGKYAAYEWGDSKEPIVLLIHGWAGRGTQLYSFIDPLILAHYRVVALDGPAHGDSLGTQTNAVQFSLFLKEAQENLGKVHAIIAHSFGAGSSVLATANGMQVAKLVLIAGPSDYSKIVNDFLKIVQLGKRSQKYFIEILSQIAKREISELRISKIGSKLATPTLVVHDKGDKEVSFQHALDIKTEWPNSELLATEGLGHRRILRDPETIKKVIGFIQSSSHA